MDHPPMAYLNSLTNPPEPQTSRKRKYQKSEQRLIMSANAVTLIECSNACPFVSRYDNYRCFYCQDQFINIPELRSHIDEEHVIPIIRPKLDNMPKGTYVMVEISDLRCRLCNVSTPDLLQLKQHLIIAHSKHFYSDIEDNLIPFLIPDQEEFKCLVCGHSFQKFQSLNTHMNSHFGDKICDICGSGFLSKARLKSHKMIHRHKDVGEYPCEECDKIFITMAKKKSHVNRVHRKVTRYRCPRCHEDFPEYYIRISHMWNVHDIPPPEFKCPMCENTYRRPHLVTLHMRKVHPQIETVDVEADIPASEVKIENAM